MTEGQIVEALRDAAGRGPLQPVGGGTVLRRLPAPPAGEAVASGAVAGVPIGGLTGVLAYEPADLVVTVRAGTTLEELGAELGARGQECPVEATGVPGSTVGGRVATGLSGLRRRGAGPLRDWLLGARFVTGDGVVASAGAATVKNVTGYDLPRLLCGSWGTLAVLLAVTLRTRPVPRASAWYRTDGPVASLYRPAAVVRLPGETRVLLEGDPRDVADQARVAGLCPAEPPVLPSAARLAVPPARLDGVLARLEGTWAAEEGVGVVHLGPLPADRLAALRVLAEDAGGRLLVWDAPEGVPAFGGAGIAAGLDRRVKEQLDPSGVLAPWRFAA